MTSTNLDANTLSASEERLTPAERALADSLAHPEFRDVHLYAFTRRSIYPDGTSRIGHPLSVLAVGSVLKDTEYFANLLTSGFAESHASSTIIRQYALEDEYDYEPDSDLDEFEERWGDSNATPGGSRVAKSNSATSTAISSKGKGKSQDSEDEAQAPQTQAVMEPSEEKKPLSRREILLPSVAHRTLRAFVFYLYTGKVNFLPLRSGGIAQRQLALYTSGTVKAPPCSPKSMYRLAELYGVPKLQDLAYHVIVSQLSPANIVEEAFSRFFARYDTLREHAVSYLSQTYSVPKVQDSLQDALDKVLLGQSPHAGLLLRSLLGLRIAIAPGPPLRAPVTTSPAPGRPPPVVSNFGPTSGDRPGVGSNPVPRTPAPSLLQPQLPTGSNPPVVAAVPNVSATPSPWARTEGWVTSVPPSGHISYSSYDDQDDDSDDGLGPVDKVPVSPPVPLSVGKKVKKGKKSSKR